MGFLLHETQGTTCENSAGDTLKTLKTKDLVGAAGFELATPCAQVGFQYALKMGYFKAFLFQSNAARALRISKGKWNRRLSTATIFIYNRKMRVP
jgi:hypothetical protein